MLKSSILFITTSSNWPKTDGKRQRTWFILDALSEVYKIDLLFIGGGEEFEQVKKARQSLNHLYHLEPAESYCLGSQYPLWLLSATKRRQVRNFTYTAQQFVESLLSTNNYTFVFFRYIDSFFSIKLPRRVQTVIDIDDVYEEKMRTSIQQQKSYIRKIKLLILFLINSIRHKTVYTKANLILVTKDEDCQRSGLKKAAVIRNLPFSFYGQAQTVSATIKPCLGFIGKLSYPPNTEGLIWFLSQVWPKIVTACPDLRFVIAGTGEVPATLKQIIGESTSVDFMGFVTDVRSFWEKISVSVVPVFSGGGTNIKIAESFSYGRPVISSEFSAKGYREEKERGFLVTPVDANEWVRFVYSVFQQPTQLLTLSNASANYAADTYNLQEWKQSLFTVLKLLQHK